MSPRSPTQSQALTRVSTLALLALFAQLTGCANLNDTGLAAMATRVDAYAVVNEQLVQGVMTLYPNHTGTVALQLGGTQATSTTTGIDLNAAPKPLDHSVLNSCVGRFRYTATAYGTVDLHCNDGTTSDLRMALIGETRGYGYGHTATGLSSLTFGMEPAEARAHLTVPPSKQLIETGTSSGLEMK
ncbi:MAG: hypothetical protein ABIZ09_10265 [Rhodoferax sp.]